MSSTPLSSGQRIIVRSPDSIAVVNSGPVGPPGSSGTQVLTIPFTKDGLLGVYSGKWVFQLNEAYNLTIVRARVLTNVPTGGDVVINLNVTLPSASQVSVWNDPADYLRIVDGEVDSGPVSDFDVVFLPANSLVGPFDIVEVSPNSISDLIATVELTKA